MVRSQALFEANPEEDCGVLDIVGRPEHLVVTTIAVPPLAIRPSVEMDGASNEDDISMKLMVRVRGGYVCKLQARFACVYACWLLHICSRCCFEPVLSVASNWLFGC
jgi:hypothetical protein